MAGVEPGCTRPALPLMYFVMTHLYRASSLDEVVNFICWLALASFSALSLLSCSSMAVRKSCGSICKSSVHSQPGEALRVLGAMQKQGIDHANLQIVL